MSNQPLPVVVISPERVLHQQIASALEQNSSVERIWTWSGYPEPSQLDAMRTAATDFIVFLDFADRIRAEAVASELDASYPSASVVAVHDPTGPQDLIDLMHFGIREILVPPVKAEDVNRAFRRVNRKRMAAGGDLIAFLPAKPGSGATTLAAHAAAAVARMSKEQTLLIDLDFRLGMTSFLFQLHGEYSVLDALDPTLQLDQATWDRLVCRRDYLDVLGSAPVDFGKIDPERNVIRLIDFAQQMYQCVFVDLPGEMREYELEVVRRAKECFLVCTPEIGSLHMARKKAAALREFDLHPRVSLVMNQVQGKGFTMADVETILQLPVRFSVAAADREISEATRRGVALEGRSALASQIENIARRVIPHSGRAKSKSRTRKFIELFSVSPIRDRPSWWSA